MIDKDIIEYVLNKSINSIKCSAPKYFSRKNRKYMDEFAQRTKDLDYEQVIVLDPKGNMISTNEGKENQVSIDEYDVRGYVVQKPYWVGGEDGHMVMPPEKFNELDIDHNHPTIKGFDAVPPILSPNDIDKLTSNINGGFAFRSITAESNGMRMSLIRQYKTEYRKNTMDYTYQHKMEKKIREVNNHYWKSIAEYVGLYKNKLSEYTNIPNDELKDYFKNSTDADLRYDISKRAVNEIGTLKSFLEKEGIMNEYQECDIELLIEE